MEHFDSTWVASYPIIFKEPANITTRFVFNADNLRTIGGWFYCSHLWDGYLDTDFIRSLEEYCQGSQ